MTAVRGTFSILAALAVCLAAAPAWADTSAESDAQFFMLLACKPAATLGDGYRAVALLVRGDNQLTDQAACRKFLVERSIARAAWGDDLKAPLSKGRLAYLVCQALGLKGGLTMRLIGPTERYCLLECAYLNLMVGGTDYKHVTGVELVSVIDRADRYRAEHSPPAPKPADADPGAPGLDKKARKTAQAARSQGAPAGPMALAVGLSSLASFADDSAATSAQPAETKDSAKAESPPKADQKPAAEQPTKTEPAKTEPAQAQPQQPAPPSGQAAQAQQPAPATQPAQPAAPPPEVCTVKSLSGTVEWRPKADAPWQPVKEGDKLPLGADICTGIRAKCLLEFADQSSAVEVQALTVLRLGEFSRDGDKVRTRVYVLQGATRAIVERAKFQSDFAIVTPEVTLAVRGTWVIELWQLGDTGPVVSLTLDGGVLVTDNATGRARYLEPGDTLMRDLLQALENVKFDYVVPIYAPDGGLTQNEQFSAMSNSQVFLGTPGQNNINGGGDLRRWWLSHLIQEYLDSQCEPDGEEDGKAASFRPRPSE